MIPETIKEKMRAATNEHSILGSIIQDTTKMFSFAAGAEYGYSLAKEELEAKEKEIDRLKALIKSEFLASHVLINKKITGYEWNEIYRADWEEYCKENNL